MNIVNDTQTVVNVNTYDNKMYKQEHEKSSSSM